MTWWCRVRPRRGGRTEDVTADVSRLCVGWMLVVRCTCPLVGNNSIR